MTSRRTLLAAGGASVAALLAAKPTATASAGAVAVDGLTWHRLPDLPAQRTSWSDEIPVGGPHWRSLGVAGPVAGAHGRYLVVAGGANFPEPAQTSNRSPDLGKVYWTDAFVLERGTGGTYRWLDADLRLADALAYSACLSTQRGALVIGGEGFRGGPNGTGRAPVEPFADVFYLRYDPRRGELVRTDLPPLPRPMSYAAAALVGDVVYVAEGTTFVSLDLTDTGAGWSTLPTWPGDPRTVAVAASDGRRFYLLSGRTVRDDGTWVLHTDAYAYEPGRRRWTRLADLPRCATAGFAVGDPAGVTVCSGDGDAARRETIEAIVEERDQNPRDSAEWTRLDDLLTMVYDHHTGFDDDVLRYDARRDRWTTAGRYPGAPQVTTPAVAWGDDTVVATGEIRPGVRTPAVWRVSAPGRR